MPALQQLSECGGGPWGQELTKPGLGRGAGGGGGLLVRQRRSAGEGRATRSSLAGGQRREDWLGQWPWPLGATQGVPRGPPDPCSQVTCLSAHLPCRAQPAADAGGGRETAAVWQHLIPGLSAPTQPALPGVGPKLSADHPTWPASLPAGEPVGTAAHEDSFKDKPTEPRCQRASSLTDLTFLRPTVGP